MTNAGYEAIKQGKRSGKWQNAYTSKTLPEIPDDLQNALQLSPTAQRNFQAFPKHNGYMWLGSTRTNLIESKE